MFKLIIIMMFVGATSLVAAPTSCLQELDLTMAIQGGQLSEQVVEDLLQDAATEWQTSTSSLWHEYRSSLLKIEKVGKTSAGDDVYLLDRLKTGGSLVLILDVEAA